MIVRRQREEIRAMQRMKAKVGVQAMAQHQAHLIEMGKVIRKLTTLPYVW